MVVGKIGAWPLMLGALWLCATAAAAQAQTLRDDFRAAARATDLGNGLQALSMFGGAPGVSAASFSIEDVKMDSYKVPLSRSFRPFGSGWFEGVAPYGELTLGYLRTWQDAELTILPPAPTRADSSYQTFSGLAGAGLDFAVGRNDTIRPILLAGYARVESDTDFNGPNAAVLDAATRGILFNISIDTILAGAAVEYAHRRTLVADVRFKTKLRYTHLFNFAYKASDPALEADSDFGIATGSAELNGPIGLKLTGRELRWIAFTSGTWLVAGGQRDALGFNHFLEVGGGIELVDPTVVRGVEGVSLRTSALVGDGVTGWSIGLSLSF